MDRSVITEAQIRQIINEEVALRMLEEGIWDDVKQGALKLRQLAAKQFGSAAQKWGQAINDKLSKLQLPEEVKTGIAALKAGMQESGESIELDDNLKSAKELSTFTTEKANALAQEDFEGPVHSLAAKVQGASTKAESRHYGRIYAVLLEGPEPQEQLNEFGLSAAFGVGLAVMGGMPMLFSGLKKLANLLRAHKLAHLFEHAEHVAHSIEVKVINAVVPNKLSYAAYKFLHNRGLRFSDEQKDLLSYEEYTSDADKSHAMKRVNGLLYKSLLIYFAFNGLAGVLHAGASLIGVVEGAATTVKGVELARGAMELAALAGKSA